MSWLLAVLGIKLLPFWLKQIGNFRYVNVFTIVIVVFRDGDNFCHFWETCANPEKLFSYSKTKSSKYYINTKFPFQKESISIKWVVMLKNSADHFFTFNSQKTCLMWPSKGFSEWQICDLTSFFWFLKLFMTEVLLLCYLYENVFST